MQGKQFLYMAQNGQGQFGDYSTGFLRWTGVPTPLIYTPDGWQDLTITEEMDSKYFGLDRTYGTPQNFVEDGAGILKTIFYTYGYNFPVTLLILEQQLYLDDDDYGYYYQIIAKSTIDLTTFSHQGEKVVAQILEGDLKAMFQANESTVYEVPLTDANNNYDKTVIHPLIMDGLKLQQYANYIIQDPVDPNFKANGNNIIGLEITSTEQKTQLGTQNVTRLAIDQNPDIFKNAIPILGPVPIDTQFQIDVDFGMLVTLAPGITPNPAVKYGLSLRVCDSNGNFQNIAGTTIFEVDGPDALYNHRIQVKGSVTIHVQKGWYIYLWSGINITNESGGEGATAVFFNYDTTTSSGLDTASNVTIQYDWQYQATTVAAAEPLYILQYLVGQISGGIYTAKSDFLTSLKTMVQTPYTPPFCLYTSGDGIRGLAGAVINTSLDDFFASLNATYNLGLGIINNVLVVEPKAFWVTPPAGQADVDLGPGSKYQCDLWTDVLFNTILIGSPNETYDEALGDINGRYEFNMTHTYGTAITGVNVQLDLTTKCRRDMYGAEYTRINLDGKLTSDASSDNDLFELAAIGPKTVNLGPLGVQTLWILDRTPNPYVSGLLDNETAFNIKVSPKHCLYRHGSYIRSVMHRMESTFVTLTTADKNVPMVTTYPNGFIVDERAKVEVSNFDPPIFLPYIFSDTTSSPEATIQGDQVKRFTFSYNGAQGPVQIKGTSMKTSFSPSDYKVAAMQILATPDLDMTDYIDIWD